MGSKGEVIDSRSKKPSGVKIAPPLIGKAAPRQVVPAVVKQKTLTTVSRRPLAPPAYRPQPQPKVLQTKNQTAFRQLNESKRSPEAPAAYCPQRVPKVLQRAPVQTVLKAPPAYRAQPKQGNAQTRQPLQVKTRTVPSPFSRPGPTSTI